MAIQGGTGREGREGEGEGEGGRDRERGDEEERDGGEQQKAWK